MSFDAQVVADFLCQTFKVQDVAQIEPFAGCSMASFQLMRPSTCVIELEKNMTFNVPNTKPISNNQIENAKVLLPFERSCFLGKLEPKQPVQDPSTQKSVNHDMNRACVYGLRATSYTNQGSEQELLGRINFVHKGMAEAEETDVVDDLIAASGGVRSAFINMPPTDASGKDTDATAIYIKNSHYTSPSFIQTMALVNEKNVMNGILEIPKEVCIKAKLPVFQGVPDLGEALLEKLMKGMSLDPKKDEELYIQKKEEMKSDLRQQMEAKIEANDKVEYFVAIPANHVLSYVLHSDIVMARMGIRSEQFRIKPSDQEDGYVLYFLVPNPTFEFILSSFKDMWLGKVDMRPLHSIGFEVLPWFTKTPNHLLGRCVEQHVKVRLIVSFMTPPQGLTQEFVDRLAPILSPQLPPIESFSLDRAEMDQAIQSHMQKRVL